MVASDTSSTPAIRTCEAKECGNAGLYRAPKDRQNLNHYRWFCLEHVRAYNAQWDFYAGMNAEEIEQHRTHDVTWQRPTWPMKGSSQLAKTYFYTGMEFDIKTFTFEYTATPTKNYQFFIPSTQETKALRLLEVSLPLTLEQLKTAYKKMVKKFHPDANRGCKDSEERLKNINNAYALLKKRFYNHSEK